MQKVKSCRLYFSRAKVKNRQKYRIAAAAFAKTDIICADG